MVKDEDGGRRIRVRGGEGPEDVMFVTALLAL
jgi:hypothetical protein